MDIKVIAKKGDKILDTHLGSGTIAVACDNMGFDLTACEISTSYYKKSLNKIKENNSQVVLDLDK